jgi:predicted RNA-binding protein with PIN domain
MARVLDSEEGFRSLVAESATRDDLGRLSWLWLARPERWEDELDRILEDEQLAREITDRERALEARLEVAEREATALKEDLAQAHAEHSRLAAETDRVRRVGADAATARRAAEQSLSEALAEKARLEAALAHLGDRLRASEQSVERLRVDAAEARRRSDAASADLRSLRLSVDELTQERERSTAAHRLVAEEAVSARRAAADALFEVLRARALLDSELEGLALALGVDTHSRNRAGTEAVSGAPGFEELGFGQRGAGEGPTGASPGEPGTADERHVVPRGPRRVPVALPPAVLDESDAAAAHLVRSPRVVLIVDGYNVALRSWPGGGLPDLRDRLVNALAELAIRLQIPVRVYFDGNDVGGRVPPPPAARPWMSVHFTDSDREADEEIVGAISALDPDLPVVVATDDGQVRKDSAALGANVISVGQLLSVIGRRASQSG